MERRTYAAFKKQWPGNDTVEIVVTSPKIDFNGFIRPEFGKDQLINIIINSLFCIPLLSFGLLILCRCYSWRFAENKSVS